MQRSSVQPSGSATAVQGDLDNLQYRWGDFLAVPSAEHRGASGDAVQDLNSIEFEALKLNELNEDDWKCLDKARRSSTFYVFTPIEFADALKDNTYDIWKLRGLPAESQLLILTTVEVYPRDRYLMVHYLSGWGCVEYIPAIKEAAWRLADRLGCSKIHYLALKETYARFLGDKKIGVLYEMER